MKLKDFVKNWCRNNAGFLLGASTVGALWLLSSLGVI